MPGESVVWWRYRMREASCGNRRPGRARSWLAGARRKRAGRSRRHGRGEEEGRKGNGGWENEEMGWKELLRAGQWRADGCKRIYWERVQRYCSGSERERREREREGEEREGVTFSLEEREGSNVRGEPVTAYYHFIHDLFFSLELWLLPNLQCCCLAVP